jgi:hypothetical protein
MAPDEYRRALDAALREYERALADRAALDTRIAQLHQTIASLTRLCGLTPTVPLGLTDACRLVLRGAGRPMTPVDVRDRLLAIGCDLDRYANALAAIHTVLKRLAESGEVRSSRDPNRSVAYAPAGGSATTPVPRGRGAGGVDAAAGHKTPRPRRPPRGSR